MKLRELELRELLNRVDERNLALMGLARTRLEREIEEIQEKRDADHSNQDIH